MYHSVQSFETVFSPGSVNLLLYFCTYVIKLSIKSKILCKLTTFGIEHLEECYEEVNTGKKT